MKVVKDHILVKPEEAKKSMLIVEDDNSNAFSRGEVISVNGGEITIGSTAIFGSEYDVIDVEGQKLLVMHYTNVKVYFEGK